jgi:hypothetical protein
MIDLFGPSLPSQGVTVRPGETRSFGAADTFFKDCTDPALNDGTAFDAAFFNALLANWRGIARGNGNKLDASPVLADNNAADDLLLSAIKYLIQRNVENYAVDSGTANAIIVAPSPAMVEYKAGGAPIRVLKSGSTNTLTTPTINVSGLGAKTIIHASGAALAPGDLPASGMLSFVYDGTNMRLTSGGKPPSQSALQKAAFPTVVIFDTPGAITWVVPAGVTRIRVHVIGGGGGGGTGHATFVGGAGGGGGGYGREDMNVTPGATLAGVVGSGGAGGPVNTTTAGSNGGTTTFNSTIQATGGGGGEAGVGDIPGTPASSPGGIGSGGDINLRGSYGSSGASGTNTTNGYHGYGGLGGSAPSLFGGHGGMMSTGSPGNGVGYGGGGSGGGSATGVNSLGGDGFTGAIIIEYVDPS